MPRSRDFPINGTEFLKVWKASLINKLIQGINESKVKILQDDNNNNDSGLENDIDINDWQEVETIVNELDDLIGSSSLAPEHKKTLLRSKMTLYNYMLEKLSMAKLQTGHSHGH
jgi:flagellin-specific chaperone FliS